MYSLYFICMTIDAYQALCRDLARWPSKHSNECERQEYSDTLEVFLYIPTHAYRDFMEVPFLMSNYDVCCMVDLEQVPA